MTGLWDASMEEAALMAATVLCFLASLGLFIGDFNARKSERLERRLSQFTAKVDEPIRNVLQPVRIDLERDGSEEARPTKKSWRLLLGNQFSRKLPLHRRFTRAGIDPLRGQRYFFAARIFCFFLSSTGAGFLLISLAIPVGIYMSSAAVIIAGISGSFWPYFLLNYHIRQRQKRIERAMPDMIDLLILCVEAGLTLEVALARAIEGLEPFAPDVAAEMKITLSELKILPDKSMALTNLEKRTASKSLKYLVLSLRQSEKYGTSITGALKLVAMENRKHAMLELENNAARMPALLSIPLILFILPPVVALSAGPGFALMMRAIGG